MRTVGRLGCGVGGMSFSQGGQKRDCIGFHVAEFSGKGFRYDGTGVVIRMGVLVGGSVGFW